MISYSQKEIIKEWKDGIDLATISKEYIIMAVVFTLYSLAELFFVLYVGR